MDSSISLTLVHTCIRATSSEGQAIIRIGRFQNGGHETACICESLFAQGFGSRMGDDGPFDYNNESCQ
jgi:hypothetical protein